MADQKPTAQERTEQATPKRLQEARERGEVVRSRELATVAVLLTAAGGLAILGPNLLADLLDVTRQNLAPSPTVFAAELPLVQHLHTALLDAVWSLIPFLAVVSLGAVLGSMALGGWIFSPQLLRVRWSKLDPIKGFKRVFALRGLMELVKALAKFILVTGAAVLLLWQFSDRALTISAVPLRSALGEAAALLMWSFLALCATLAVIAAADIPFQVWNHARQLRMSRQQVKDELKETEGKPEVKARIRELQRAVARRRMMEAVPQADVVITNPKHYAVALRYAPDKANAPRVIAKGADLLALRIQAVARNAGVPVVRSPVLARAVYFSTKLDQEIPAGLYSAVAQIFAYVYSVRQRRPAQRGAVPPPPDDLPIPEELRRDAD
ncbi:MAG: flagellar biosynthesis protein FlhB [Gammaproteobacteria bacterium]|jgi:flagellar biosynthesis protein FlhB